MSEILIDSNSFDLVPVSSVVTPSVPTNLVVTAFTTSSISVACDIAPFVQNIAYRLYHSVDGGNNYFVLTLLQPAPGVTPAFTDSGLVLGATKYYKMTCCLYSGGVVSNETGFSNIVHETTRVVTTPNWWNVLADSVWTTIAGGAGQKVSDHVPNPITTVPIWATGGPNQMFNAWAGGGFDIARNRLFLCANGGHADYAGNESYMLDLLDPTGTPQWRRITENTPPGAAVGITTEPGPFINGPAGTPFNFGTNGGTAIYADGYPRADHATFERFGDDKVWFTGQSNYTSGGSGHGSVHCFNTRHPSLLTAIANGVPLARDPIPAFGGTGTIRPWEFYVDPPFVNTTLGGAGQWSFGVACHDPVRHRMWAFGGKSRDMASPVQWYVSTLGATMGQATDCSGLYVGSGGDGENYLNAHAACYCPDMDIIVVFGSDEGTKNGFMVLNLVTSTTTKIGASKHGLHNTSVLNGYCGMVYQQVNHSILLWSLADSNHFYKVVVPRIGNAYDPSGSWATSTVAVGGVNPIPIPLDANGNPSGTSTIPLSKMVHIEDMGDGRGGIVVPIEYNTPTYVLKLPAAGL